MACTSVAISSSAAAAAAKEIVDIRRSESAKDLRCDFGSRIQRSRSEPQLRCSLIVPRALTGSRSSSGTGIFPFNFSVPRFFDSDESVIDQDQDEEKLVDGIETENRVNWVERILELRTRWRSRQQKEEEEEGEDNYYCGVGYESDEEQQMDVEDDEEWDPVKFRRFLTKVPWSETKLFSKLAFLCNMAYVIPQIKVCALNFDFTPCCLVFIYLLFFNFIFEVVRKFELKI